MAKTKKDKTIGGVTAERAAEVQKNIDATVLTHDSITMSELTAAQVIELETALKYFVFAAETQGFSEAVDWSINTVMLCETMCNSIRPRVAFKNGKTFNSISGFKLNGKWTNDLHVVGAVSELVAKNGVAYGQALAQMFNAKWAYDAQSKTYFVKHDDWGFYPIGKAFKFLRNGAEDSLASVIGILFNKKSNDEMRSSAFEKIKHHVDGFDYFMQDWHNDNGKLTETRYIDKATNKVLMVCVYSEVQA